MERLTGSALLEKIRELNTEDHREVAVACGYVGQSGKRALMQAFYAALMEANGGSSRGRAITGTVSVHSSGMISVGSSWTGKLGLKTGDRVNISISRGRIVITPEKTETEESETTTEACTISATTDTTETPTSTTTYIESTSVTPTTWTAPAEIPTATTVAV